MLGEEVIVNGICIPNLSCYHNLISYIMMRNNNDLRYLGGHWPWRFNIDSNYAIRSHKVISHTIIKSMYNIDLIYNQFTTNEPQEIWCAIQQLLNETSLLIVGTDSLPYMKFDPNNNHSIIISRINAGEVYCIDTIPVFTGLISADDVLSSITRLERPWYAYLKFPEVKEQISDEKIFQAFIEEVGSMKSYYCEEYPIALSTTKDILTLVETAKVTEDIHILQNLCRGKWGWHIKRNVGMFLSYLTMDYVEKIYRGKLDEIRQLTLMISDIWSIAYKQMFMASISNPNRISSVLEKSLTHLNRIVRYEIKLINILLN